MPVILLVFILSCTAFCGANVAPGKPGVKGRGGTGTNSLQTLPCTGTCDLQLVADDWSGSGAWSSRVGGWSATLTGSLTKASSKFAGRSEISGFSSGNYFSLAANAAHTIQTNEATTYEFLVKTPAVFTAAGNVVGYNNGATLPIMSLGWLTSAGGNYENTIYNNVGGAHITTISSNSLNRTSEYYLLTVTIDLTAPRLEQYVNGTPTHNATTVFGTLASSPASALGIGIRAVSLNNIWGGAIVEIVRHKSVLSSAQILSRSTNFNKLKGY